VHSRELEALSGLSRYELARQFRHRYGTSPYRYLLMRRRGTARKLIAAAKADWIIHHRGTEARRFWKTTDDCHLVILSFCHPPAEARCLHTRSQSTIELAETGEGGADASDEIVQTNRFCCAWGICSGDCGWRPGRSGAFFARDAGELRRTTCHCGSKLPPESPRYPPRRAGHVRQQRSRRPGRLHHPVARQHFWWYAVPGSVGMPRATENMPPCPILPLHTPSTASRLAWVFLPLARTTFADRACTRRSCPTICRGTANLWR